MHPPDVRQRYFDRLDLPGDSPSPAHRAALARAHELRRFEIENYWKRSSYFWGFQLVSFGALALTAKDGRFAPPLVLIVAVLGALAALTGALSARGSKFWQENWEAHVDYLEPAVEGRLHGTTLARGSLPHSVSRVNERFLWVLFAGWLAAFVASAVVALRPGLLALAPATAAVTQVSIAVLALGGGLVALLAGTRANVAARGFYRDTMTPVA